MLDKYDIVINGNSLVGGLFAKTLATIPKIKIAVIEKRKINNQENKLLDNRGIVLNKFSIDFLSKFNLWDIIKNKAHIINKIHISEQNKFGSILLDKNKFNLDFLGYLIDLDSLLSTLKIHNNNNIKLFQPDFIKTFKLINNNWEIILNSGNKIYSNLLVAADGTNSLIRKSLKIPTEVIVPAGEQAAIVGTIPGLNIKDLSYQKISDIGIFAFLPFGENTKFVMTSTAKNIDSLIKNQEHTIVNVNNILSRRYRKITKITNLLKYDLKQISSLKIVDENLLFLGNAANTISPVMAQGYNLAIRDIAVFYYLLNNNQNINYNFLLSRYKKLRTKDHDNTKFLIKLLTNKYLFKNLGINIVGLSNLLQEQIVKNSIGETCIIPD